jgi:hypothetical protein
LLMRSEALLLLPHTRLQDLKALLALTLHVIGPRTRFQYFTNVNS